MSIYSYAYLFAPEAGTTVTVYLMSGSFSSEIPVQPPTTPPSQTVVPGTTISIYNDSPYAEGYVTISYQQDKTQQTAECHLNFLLNSMPPWQLDSSGAYPNDEQSIIGQYSSATPDNIPVVKPSGSVPGGIDSLYQILDPYMVFLVDQHKNGNMLFRGNVPFAEPKVANGFQKVDFDKLHEYMKSKYEAQTGETDFPQKGNYVLCDICLQSTTSEGGSILMELQSFGGTELSQLADRAWYPSAPASPLNAQICNWEIEPHQQPSNDAFDYQSAKLLSDMLNTTQTVPYIYYIHCASGHDRTGIVASSYLIVNRSQKLKKALIQGTTIGKLPSDMAGTQLIVNCVDIDGTNKGNVDPQRSRIMMIANVYDTTVLNIYNSANPTNPVNSIPTDALSTNPAYVCSEYPWQIGKEGE